MATMFATDLEDYLQVQLKMQQYSMLEKRITSIHRTHPYQIISDQSIVDISELVDIGPIFVIIILICKATNTSKVSRKKSLIYNEGDSQTPYI